MNGRVRRSFNEDGRFFVLNFSESRVALRAMPDKRLVVLHLSLIERVGPATIAQIAKAKPEHCSWDMLYSFTITEWISLGLSHKAAIALHAGLANRLALDNELALIEKHDVSWLTFGDADYPSLLAHIAYPPPILYYKGAPLEAHKKNIAMVGSREADSYAQRVISMFVPSLVEHGWSLVSGGALGVDSMVHRATLEAQGKTIVVLGSGLLRPYPRSNTALFERVVSGGGTIVSSFGLTVDPIAHNFPSRNRIIAGLSSGCVVVQAAQKSGASITAHYALEEGRTVFAVPGMIDNPLSVGCHALLQEGANVATCVQDILKELGENVQQPSKQLTFVPQEPINKEPVKVKSAVVQPQVPVQAGTRPPVIVADLAGSHSYALDSVEARVIQFCVKPSFLDDVAQHCALSCADMQQILFNLQLEGLVHQNFAGQWASR